MDIIINHELKTWKDYFEEILSGAKKFELRLNDRDFKVGDVVKLLEYENIIGYFTERSILIRITQILKDAKHFGLMDGFCIFSFDILEKCYDKWISVEDHLPTDSSKVSGILKHDIYKTIKECTLKVVNGNSWCNEDNSEIEPFWSVTHWKEKITEVCSGNSRKET
jgi:hypothetical protein